MLCKQQQESLRIIRNRCITIGKYFLCLHSIAVNMYLLTSIIIVIIIQQIITKT